MKTVALLRGINVGGHNPLKMVDLRSLCSQMGWQSVATYIQSGNVVFESSQTVEQSEQALSEGLRKVYALDVPVMVVKGADWLKAIQENPFKHAEAKKLHLTWLKRHPAPTEINGIKRQLNVPDQFEIVDQCVYLNLKQAYHKTKLNNAFFEKAFATQATTRNWKTILKLGEMLSQ